MKNMITKKPNIILPKSFTDKQTDDEILKAGTKLMIEAKKMAEGKKCSKCGDKNNLKIVPLHESPFPLPSKIVLYCKKCKYNEVLIEQGSNKMMKAFSDAIQRMISGSDSNVEKEGAIKDKEITDKLIRKWKK